METKLPWETWVKDKFMKHYEIDITLWIDVNKTNMYQMQEKFPSVARMKTIDFINLIWLCFCKCLAVFSQGVFGYVVLCYIFLVFGYFILNIGQ